VAQFREQLERMRRGRFRVARLREFAGSGDAPGAGESVVGLTFDDGRVSDYETAYPLLRELGWEADFFVNTATVGSKGFLSWSQIAEMHRGGMSIQSHGHDHVALVTLSPAELSRQLRESKARLEDRLGERVEYLAVPYGLVSRRVVRDALTAGYDAVCTSWSWPVQPGSKVLGRVVVHRDTALSTFDGLLARSVEPYARRAARSLVLELPRRMLVRVRPASLGVRVAEDVT
jgi:peptidoglycan/xylan/chitin deacetylase (PgdA/CDA1 family)